MLKASDIYIYIYIYISLAFSIIYNVATPGLLHQYIVRITPM